MRVWLAFWVSVLIACLRPAFAADLSLGPILVEPLSGVPDETQRMLLRKITEELDHVGFQVGAEPVGPPLRLSGTAAATTVESGTSVTILWTLVDPRGGTKRVEVSDAAAYRADAPWTAVDVGTLSRLAQTTAFALEALQTGSDLPAKARIPAAPPAGGKAGEAVPTPTSATRVYIAAISGAPGDGEAMLARVLAQTLVQFDVVLVPTAEEGAYVIKAKVSLAKASDREDRVQIVWTLSNRKGAQLATVKQDNTVTAGSLTPHWGQTAVYAGEAAADGLLSAMGQLGPTAPEGGPSNPAPKAKAKKKHS